MLLVSTCCVISWGCVCLCACTQSNKVGFVSEPVPSPPSFLSELWYLWEQLEHDFTQVYTNAKHVVFAVYGVGFAAGTRTLPISLINLCCAE